MLAGLWPLPPVRSWIQVFRSWFDDDGANRAMGAFSPLFAVGIDSIGNPYLFRGELVAVDEYQTAGVEHYRPPSSRVSDVVTADINGMSGCISIIVDDEAAAFLVGAGVYPDPHVHCQGWFTILSCHITSVFTHFSPPSHVI
jgi:hypothetical protein